MAKRFLVQCISALLHNGNLPGFITGRIWQAQPKSVCVPVLNWLTAKHPCGDGA